MPATEVPQKPLVSFAEAMKKEMAPLDASRLAESGQAAPPQNQEQAPKADDAPKPDAKPATNFDEVDREIETGRRSPKSEDFKRVKTAAAEARRKVEEYEPKVAQYEKELAELKKAPKHNAELIKQITEERDRYKGMFEQVAVEISPEFHAKYKTRLDNVKASLPAEHAERLMAVLQLPDSDVKRKHLAEITSEMDEFQVAEVVAANREVRTILNERQGELSKSHEALSKIGEERTKKQQERQAALGKTFEEVIAKAQDSKDGIPVFQSKEGDEEWNKGVNERVAVAKAIFNGEFDSDSERAEASLWAAAAPGILDTSKATISRLESELATAKETIARMTGSTPALDGHGGAGAEGRKMSFAEKVNRDIKGAG